MLKDKYVNIFQLQFSRFQAYYTLHFFFPTTIIVVSFIFFFLCQPKVVPCLLMEMWLVGWSVCNVFF